MPCRVVRGVTALRTAVWVAGMAILTPAPAMSIGAISSQYGREGVATRASHPMPVACRARPSEASGRAPIRIVRRPARGATIVTDAVQASRCSPEAVGGHRAPSGSTARRRTRTRRGRHRGNNPAALPAANPGSRNRRSGTIGRSATRCQDTKAAAQAVPRSVSRQPRHCPTRRRTSGPDPTPAERGARDQHQPAAASKRAPRCPDSPGPGAGPAG